MKTNRFFNSARWLGSALMVAVLCTACAEDPAKDLPPATQEGKNVMACLINGEPWQNDPGVFDPRVSASHARGNLMLMGSSPENTIQFELGDVVKHTGVFLLANRCNISINNHICVQLTRSGIEYQLIENTGFLNITKLDTSSTDPMVAGTFAFDATNGTDTVRVTEGRFDIEI